MRASDSLAILPTPSGTFRLLPVASDSFHILPHPSESFAQLFEAPNASGAGLVYTHGGSERQTFAAFHFGPVYAQQYAYNQYLAVEQGMHVLSVNYRSGVGYGAAFRLCDACMSFGAAEYGDVRTAGLALGGRWPTSPPLGQLLRRAVDPSRVGIWGISYGGLNALQAVARDSHTVWAAAVSNAGIFNWISELRYFTDSGGQVRLKADPDS